MKFIADNYVWFIVGGIVILMAVIGYFAEKTNFGNKKTEENVKPVKNKKPKKSKPKSEKVEVEIKGIGDISQSITDQIKEELPVTQPDTNSEDEILYTPVGGSVPINENTVVDDSLFAPLGDTPVQQSESIEDTLMNKEEPEIKTVESTTLSEPLIDSQDNDSSVAEDDDIWKF